MLDSWLFGLKNEIEMPEKLAKIPKLFLNADYFQMPNNLEVIRRFVQPADAKFTIKYFFLTFFLAIYIKIITGALLTSTNAIRLTLLECG